VSNFLKNSIPYSVKRLYRKLFPLPKTHGWFGNYNTWNEAKQLCTGYDDSLILEKVKDAILKVKNGEAVYERDSVLFDTIQLSEPLLEAFKLIANESGNSLHIVDFGGSLGSSYFQNKNFLTHITDLKWAVVEQKHFVECGKKFMEDNHLKFYYTIEEALAQKKAQVLFLSSVIQYFEHPYELIKQCLAYNFEYIIVDRTAFLKSSADRITVQIVPETVYKASYPAWFFNEQKFVNAFLGHYSCIKEFDSKFDPEEKLEDKTWSYRKGFVFKLKK